MRPAEDSRRRPGYSAQSVRGVLALAASIPPLPGAACKGRGSLFDASTVADRIEAERLCLEVCPALGRCRRWVASLPSHKRPSGVTAGKYREGRR